MFQQRKQQNFFFEKRSKKLLLPRIRHRADMCVNPRGAKQAKVFCFFLSRTP
jgi:hypothetical protein